MPLQVADNVKEDILQKINADIDEANQYYESNVEKKIIERYDMYYAEPEYYKKKFPKLSKASSLVSTDVADTIEWALPAIMRVFFSSEDIITVQGVTPEDDDQAKKMQELLRFIIQRKNPGFQIFYNWFKDALITGIGIVKCYWMREIREDTATEVLNIDALNALKQNQGIQIISEQQVSADLFSVTYTTTTIIKSQPKIENILASELRYSPKARDLNEAPFVAHRKIVTIDYLRRKEMEGMYEAGTTDLVIESLKEPSLTQLEEHILDNYTSTTAVDEARREVEIYECYTKLDINGDGLLEDLIITKCESVVLRVEENSYGRHPFFVLSPVKDPHRIIGKKSYADLIGTLQDLKVALIRQIQINTSLSNDPRLIVSEEAINIADYVEGRSIIRKKAGYPMSDVAQPMPIVPLAPWTFNFLEYIESQKENRTGVTRYNQGLDARSLNKTATGISQIMQASNQRIEMICRMFAETGISELMRFLINLIQKFMDETTIIRVVNEPMVIRPDDLKGEFDLVICGIGLGTKEMTLMNIQQVLTQIIQVAQSGVVPVPLATPKNIFNLLKKYIEELGFKNYAEYLTDPDIMMQQQAMQQQAMLGGLINGAIPQGSIGGLAPGGTGPGGQGIPPEVLQRLQGMGGQPAQVMQSGGFNPVQNYAPRS